MLDTILHRIEADLKRNTLPKKQESGDPFNDFVLSMRKKLWQALEQARKNLEPFSFNDDLICDCLGTVRKSKKETLLKELLNFPCRLEELFINPNSSKDDYVRIFLEINAIARAAKLPLNTLPSLY